ncbi:transmembrane protein, putative (macronuclear) [Tetrahymena thermophila SB210]|uniref:Transmembrane protein, putative n=1 Tax=Tetrahymena thermophila (strain SB210) TaxID=312017 RepID=Q246B7_TETTS|nr:transmembrane protein, putative [Tetrahymena thermophila SB210]EAS03466.2 transmembrane protein, putative [Tetrahymena thermophila SB210]|eukprot:XP_001023711.2 transmembrane protein, putative [Tetrahymena thermophila SB210]
MLQINVFDKKIVQQQDLRALVNQDLNLTLSKFIIDQIYHRYIFCFNGQKIAYVWNFSEGQQEQSLFLPKNLVKQIKIEKNYLFIQCVFQINIYIIDTIIQLSTVIKKNFISDRITEFKLVNDNAVAVFFIDKFELFLISATKVQLISQQSYTYPRLLSYYFDSQRNILNIIGLHKIGVFENNYSLDIYYEDSVNECSILVQNYEYEYTRQQLGQISPKQKQIQTANGVQLISQQTQQNYIYLQVPTIQIESIIQYISQFSNNQYIFSPYDNQNNVLSLKSDIFLSFNQPILQLFNFNLNFQNYTNLLVNLTQNQNIQQIILQNITINVQCLDNNQIYASNIQKVVIQNLKITQLDFSGCLNINQQSSLLSFYNISEVFIYNLEVSKNNFSQITQIPILQFQISQTILMEGIKIIQNTNLNSLMNFQQIQKITISNSLILNNNQTKQSTLSIGLIQFYGCQTIIIQLSKFQNNNQLLLIFAINQYTDQKQKVKVMETLMEDNFIFRNVDINRNQFFGQNILLIQSSLISFNNLTYCQNDGSLLLTKSLQVSIIKSYFQANKAINGGAIYFKSIQQNIQFKESMFFENIASASGGALYFENLFECQIIFDMATKIKNNSALIGGGLRIAQTDSRQFYLPDGFPFSKNVYQNIAEIYGNDSTSYLQNLIIQNNDKTQEYFFSFQLNQQNIPQLYVDYYSRSAEIRGFKSGDFLNLRIYIVDGQGRYLSFSKDKLIEGSYPYEIGKELKDIQISIHGLQSNQNLINGQQIINYYQYDTLSQSFELNSLQILAALNQVQYFVINSTVYASSQINNPILLQIQFRNCKEGEIIQQINNQIFTCNQCPEGFYQLSDPQLLYQQSQREKSDVNRCINCPSSAVMCKANIIQLKNGFWRQKNNTDEIVECDQIINSCQAQNPNSINYCSVGYIGPICLQCDILGEVWKGSRYSESLAKGVCEACAAKASQWFYIILKIVAFEVYCLHVLGVFIQKFKYSQTCYYLRVLNILPISTNSISDYSAFYIKIILNYYQLSALLITQPKIISVNFNFLNDLFGSGNRQISIGADCLINESTIKQLGKMLFYTQVQFLIPTAALVFIPLILKFYEEFAKVKLRKYHFYLIFHINFIFFQIGSISYFIKALTCKKIGNEFYNPIDLSVNCYDSNVIKFLYPFSIIVLCFWTFLPLVFLRLIRLNKQKLDQCLTKYKYGYYYGELKHKYYYWEFIRIYLKIIIIYIYTLLNNNSQYITILTITIILGFYIKQVSQRNPFISISIQTCEIASYTLIILKIYLQMIQIQNPQAQSFVEVAQIFIDYIFFFCYLIIVIGIMMSKQTSKLAIFVKNKLLKLIPKKLYNKLIKLNKVSFQTYMRWRLVSKKIRKKSNHLKIEIKSENYKEANYKRNQKYSNKKIQANKVKTNNYQIIDSQQLFI